MKRKIWGLFLPMVALLFVSDVRMSSGLDDQGTIGRDKVSAGQLLIGTSSITYDEVNKALLLADKAYRDGDIEAFTNYFNSVISAGLLREDRVFATDITWNDSWFRLDMHGELQAPLTVTGQLLDGSTYTYSNTVTASTGKGVKVPHNTYTTTLTVTSLDNRVTSLTNTKRDFFQVGIMDWIVTFTAKKDSLYTNKTSSKGFLVDVNNDGTRDMTITSNKSEQYRYDAVGNVVASIKFEHLDKNAVAYTITPAHSDTLVATGALADSADSATALRGSICPTEPPPTVDAMTVSVNGKTALDGATFERGSMLDIAVDFSSAPGVTNTKLLLIDKAGGRTAELASVSGATLTATHDTTNDLVGDYTLRAEATGDNRTAIAEFNYTLSEPQIP